jgi:hypothetical protein
MDVTRINNNNNCIDLLHHDANILEKLQLSNYNVELEKNKKQNKISNQEKSLKYYENLIFNSLLITSKLLKTDFKKIFYIDYKFTCLSSSKVQPLTQSEILISIESDTMSFKNDLSTTSILALNDTDELNKSQTEVTLQKHSSVVKFVKKTVKINSRNLTKSSSNLQNKLKVCKLQGLRKKTEILFKDEAELYFRELNKPTANLILLLNNNKLLYVDQTILCLASERLRIELNLLKSINSKRILFEFYEYKYDDIIEMLKFIYPQFNLTIDRK